MKTKAIIILTIAQLFSGFLYCQTITARLDINSMIQHSLVIATPNTYFDIGSIKEIFDNKPNTMARTPSVNPLIITLQFNTSMSFVASSVLQTYGNGWWTIETANTLADLNNQNGSYHLHFNQHPTVDGVWDSTGLAQVNASFIRLTLKRTTGDNYVHINEWQIYINDTPDSMAIQPAITPPLHLSNTTGLSYMAYYSGSISQVTSGVNWISQQPSIATVTSSGVVTGIAIGSAFIKATCGSFTDSVTVNVIPDLNSPDLDVRFIKRLPEINYVWNSTNPSVEGWPSIGQSVTWRAYVKNWSPNNYSNVHYQWKKNGVPVQSGTISFTPYADAHSDYNLNWTFNKDTLEFIIDDDHTITEMEENNNSLTTYTYAISANFYVEQSTYNYFHDHQHSLGVGTNSWEDWAQILHVKRWNMMFKNAAFPSMPYGVIDRIRIDSIIVVPDNALPLAGGLPSNNPNLNDITVDLQWGFPETCISSGMYDDTLNAVDSNPFYFEGSLLHELGHARYLIDTYGCDITRLQVNIYEGSTLIAGSSLMPAFAWNVVHYNYQQGLMSTTYDSLSEYDALSLNRIAGHRAVCGNYNGPCNIGEFINDLPQNNYVTFTDLNGDPLPSACVEVFWAMPQSGVWYGKNFDSTPDLYFQCDSFGTTNLGNNPFNTAFPLTHNYGYSNLDIIVRVEYNDSVGYVVIEALDFNKEYFKGNTQNAYYSFKVKLLPCGNFNSSCSCSTAINVSDAARYEMKVFPVPASGMISVNLFNNNSGVEGYYSIFDIIGNKVIENYYNGDLFSINVSNLLPGIYFLKVGNDKDFKVAKFIKE